jgi:hypothetical protein
MNVDAARGVWMLRRKGGLGSVVVPEKLAGAGKIGLHYVPITRKEAEGEPMTVVESQKA